MSHPHRTIRRRIASALTALAVAIAQVACPLPADASYLGSATASAGSAPPPSVSAIQSFQPDLFTGRATTAIPLAVPPGRKGMQPSLALSYSSSGRNGWVGVGWSLDVGYIERSTKNGVPKYDSSDTFTFMVQGVSSDLVQIPDGTYRAKDEGLFFRFEHKGLSGWEVRDKSGTRYLFGQTVASQIENSGQVFRWALDKVIDLHGNTIIYAYTKDQRQLYLAQIDYTGHESTSLPQSSRVLFSLEDRSDVETSFRSGFAITTAKRLKTVETKATVSGTLVLARRTQVTYTTSPLTGRSLLSTVTQIGSDGTTSLPPTTFTYIDDAPIYMHCHNCVPTISSGNHGWQIQTQVAPLFPVGDGGNDQRLWPGGQWEPGIKHWSEKVCKGFFKRCHQEERQSAIPPVSWGAMHLEKTGASDGLNWSTDSAGNLTVNGPTFSHLLATTWLYTPTGTTVSLGSVSTSGHADFFYVPPSGNTWTPVSGSLMLQPGWTFLALTAYTETGSFSLNVNASLATQVPAMNHNQFSPMEITGDFNGDGKTDLAHLEPSTNHWHVLLNSPSGFGQEQTWLSATLPSTTIPLVGDADGDGKADLILWDSSSGQWQAAQSTGSSFQNSTTWHAGFGVGGTPLLGDFNGDQRLDVGVFASGTWRIALSDGSRFLTPTIWLSGFGSGETPLTGDFNGDGLTDVGSLSTSGTILVALSSGTQWMVQPTPWKTGFGAGQTVTSADVNGDGLTDILYYDKSSGTVIMAPSTGQSFGAVQTIMSAHPFADSLRGPQDQLQVGDFLGNGLAGFGVFNSVSGAAELASAMGTAPDLLQTVANGLGGSTTLTYRPSSELENTSLAFTIPIVTQVDTSDGLSHTYTTTYTYTGGLYDAPTQEFRGFATATVTDAVGTATTTTFAQDQHTKGRPLSSAVHDGKGRLFTKTVNTWSETEPYPNVHVAYLDQTDRLLADGEAFFLQTRSRFTYDAYGNLIQMDDDGQVDPPLSGDERTTSTTFTYNTQAWILNTPSLIQTRDTGGMLLAQRRLFYDGATSIDTPPTIGQLTKEAAWLAEPGAQSPEQWVATSLTYDAFGNVTTVTDALGRTTTNTYDPTGTFLTQVANALSHTRQMTMDARTGQVLTSTDANGQITTTQYDALGRVIAVVGPLDTASLPTTRATYDLSTVPTKTTACARVQSGQVAEVCTLSFMDGLGRTIQTRSPAQDPAKQIVSGAVEFDARGLVIKQWTPYRSSVSSSYVPVSLEPSASSLAAVSYSYDALGRLHQTTDADGSVSLVDYQRDETITTPPIGAQVRKQVDVYGRLIRVTEVLSETDQPITTYRYDALGRLAQVTDAKGNQTTITYDSLGRKLSMDDPDMGRWSYTYDAVDNLTSQTDARGVTTTFTYDPLNRLLRKEYAVPSTLNLEPSTAVRYTYDDPVKPFSKGKLMGITDGSGSSSFEYDKLGRLVKEIKTIDGTARAIQRQYDLLGRLTRLTQPSGDVATYTYNLQGGLQTIDLTPAAQPLRRIVTAVNYNVAGQLTKITYGNGTVSDYTYNPQTLRLDQLKTTGPSGTLQDFTYTFDAVGNVTGLTDRVHTGTQTFEYDLLSRLTRAQGRYGDVRYAYDAIGNMLQKESSTLTYGLADGTKPHAVTTVADSTQPLAHSLTYDANGNLLEKAVDRGLSTVDLAAQRLTYDADNRLVEVKTASEETVTLTLKPGWNFFSLPVIPDDLRITAIFPSFAQDFTQLAWYDANPTLPPPQRFKRFVNHSKFNQFDRLQYGQGYQLYCKHPSGVTLTLKGKLPTQQVSTNLLPGWHLLPAITLDAKPVSWLTQGLAATDVRVFDATTQTLKPATTLEAGQAYFVHLTTTSLFAPPLVKDPTTRFVYDGDGGRVKQITSAGTTIFLGSSLEIDPTGKTTEYLFAGSQRIAAFDSTGTWRFYHGDHLGSTNLVTNSTGQVVEVSEYTPYGSLATHTGTVDVAHKFTGQRLDQSTGLYFYNARYYDPHLGRFIQPDTLVQAPSDPQTLNRYSYCRNNPVKYIDPSGHSFFKKFWRAIVGVATAAVAVVAPPLAPAMWAVNVGISAATAIQTGNVAGFVGGLAGGAVFGAIGQGIGLGMATSMGPSAYTFLGGAIAGAAEFGAAGFGSGFGAALASGGSFRDAFRAGGIGAAFGAASGAAIQGSYMAGWQDTLHGNSVGQVAGAQGQAAVQTGRPGDLAGINSAVRSRTRGALGLYLHGTNAKGAAGISASGQLDPWSWVTLPHAIDAMTGKPAIMLNPAQYRAFTGIPSYDKGEFFALLVAPSTSVHWRGLSEGAAPQAQIYGEHEVLRGSPYPNPNP